MKDRNSFRFFQKPKVPFRGFRGKYLLSLKNRDDHAKNFSSTQKNN